MLRKIAIASAMTAFVAGGLQAQTVEEALAALESRVSTLESKVAWLETFHQAPREFTVKQSTLTYDDFNSKLAALGLQEGEWLYVKTEGDFNGDGVVAENEYSEMCTSDTRFTSMATKYFDQNLDNNSQFFIVRDLDNNLTYVSSHYIQGGETWQPAGYISGDVYKYERIKMKALASLRSTSFDILTRQQAINFYSEDPNNTVTFKAGATRQEACGF